MAGPVASKTRASGQEGGLVGVRLQNLLWTEVVGFLDFGHFNGCVVAPHCLSLQFLSVI